MPCMNRASILHLRACYEELVLAPSDFRNRFPQEIPPATFPFELGDERSGQNTGPGGAPVDLHCIVFEMARIATCLAVELVVCSP